MKMKLLSIRGATMEAVVRTWGDRIYVNFPRNPGKGTICLTRDGKIVPKESHRSPVLAPGEVERILKAVS